MRPILWGTIWFVIGMIGWLAFSIIGGTLEGLSGEAQPLLKAWMLFFAIVFFFSLPVAIIVEIFRWIKARKKKHKTK